MRTLIFLNGEIPNRKIVEHYKKGRTIIIAADGGCKKLKSINIIPNVIIGDLDSAGDSALRYFRSKGSKIIKIDEQETTDFEKSLIYCKANNLLETYVFGFSGLRIDHTVNNLSILKRHTEYMNIKMIDNEFEVFIINKSTSINYRKNELFSFVGMPKAFNIHTKGLKYKLKGENLKFGIREGTLNLSTSKVITLNFDKGDLLIFKKHFLN
ncbi:MAG: hypothetical protein HGGPFJEG_02697 [Ignavibacteria bacterium]|nr:hypothetical protein [Ignavibacteria bacterium]